MTMHDAMKASATHDVCLTNRDFAAALFRDIAPGDHGTLHSIFGDPAKAKGWPAKPWQPGKRLPTLSPFNNNYLSVSSFHPTVNGERYRRKVSFAGLHAVMIDDLGTKLPMTDLRMQPSVLVQTSPGNYQAWLFLEEPIRSLPAAERLIDQMIHHGITAAADPGMKGVTRIARLPCGSNGKAVNCRNGKPWTQPDVVDARLELRYTVQEVAVAYGLDLTLPRCAPPLPRPRGGIDAEHARVIQFLQALDMHLDELREGYHAIRCPWADQHSDRGKTGTYYMEPNADNAWRGGFMCHHGHCGERDINDLLGWIRAQIDMACEMALENGACDEG